MASWKEMLAGMIVDIEDHIDRAKYRLWERLGLQRPIIIIPYRGFGTNQEIYIKGRVLENKNIQPAGDDDTVWDNLVNMYKRFESDEVPFARVRVSFQGSQQEAAANEEGFFDVTLPVREPLPADRIWHPVEIELLHPIRKGEAPARAEGQVLIPPQDAEFGVISDIDDTILQTNATHLIQMARTVFLGNARTRLPFKGVAAFYRALLHGAQGDASSPLDINPLFFVSSSPWNIYDLLSDFFEYQNIPLGPVLFLRDWGISREELLPTQHRDHKLRAIRRVFDLYTHLPFLLIGDSGQEDPEIYAEIVKLYPGRVKAIYIRNVSRDLARPEAIAELARQVAKDGTTLILAEDTLPMAQHAAEQGWISPSALPAIQDEKEADEAPPTKLEELVGAAPEKEEAPAVVVDTRDPQAAQEAVEEGAIEEALEVGKQDSKKPPTVIVEGNDDQED